MFMEPKHTPPREGLMTTDHHDTYVADPDWNALRDNLASVLVLPFERDDPEAMQRAQDRATAQMQALRIWPASIEAHGTATAPSVPAAGSSEEQATLARIEAKLDAILSAQTPAKIKPDLSRLALFERGPSASELIAATNRALRP